MLRRALVKVRRGPLHETPTTQRARRPHAYIRRKPFGHCDYEGKVHDTNAPAVFRSVFDASVIIIALHERIHYHWHITIPRYSNHGRKDAWNGLKATGKAAMAQSRTATVTAEVATPSWTLHREI